MLCGFVPFSFKVVHLRCCCILHLSFCLSLYMCAPYSHTYSSFFTIAITDALLPTPPNITMAFTVKTLKNQIKLRGMSCRAACKVGCSLGLGDGQCYCCQVALARLSFMANKRYFGWRSNIRLHVWLAFGTTGLLNLRTINRKGLYLYATQGVSDVREPGYVDE